jgi:glycosyltransferase involved in cell wall biosynthesis
VREINAGLTELGGANAQCYETKVISDDFDWRRLWQQQPLESQRRDGDSNGNGNGDQHTPLRPLEELSEVSCLVLLGSPGIGKSHELQRLFNRTTTASVPALLKPLRSVRSRDELASSIADAGWHHDRPFELFLDGLDEAAVPVRDLFGWIVESVAAASRGGKVRLRITSRPTAWQGEFERELVALFGNGNVEVYNLDPLTRADVALAIETKFGTASNPLEALVASGLPLLGLPVTLRMLLSLAEKNSELPHRRIEVYRRALLALIDHAADRSQPTGAHRLSADEGLLVAARIALAATLSNRHDIWTGSYAEASPERTLAIHDIAGGQEESLGAHFHVTEHDLRRVIETGIFTRKGDKLYSWTHLSFAEFLAGYYLAAHVSDPERLASILSPNAPLSNRLAPQMREVAGWVAALVPQFFTHVLRREPEILLSSDAIAGDDVATAQLVGELLNLASRDPVAASSIRGSHAKFERLNHPTLSSQLAEVISDTGRGKDARTLAIDIGGSNRLSELTSTLLPIVSSRDEADETRAHAASALRSIADPHSLVQLRDALLAGLLDPMSDEVRGAILFALWPTHIQFADLIRFLVPPTDGAALRQYRYFLLTLKPTSLNELDVVAGLNWLKELRSTEWTHYDFREVISIVLNGVWSHKTSLGVMNALADVIIASRNEYHAFFYQGDLGAFRDGYREAGPGFHRRFLSTLLARSDADQFERSLSLDWALVSIDDLPWLLNDLRSGNSPFPRNWLISAIFWVTSGRSPDEVSELWDIAENDEEFAKALAHRFTSELDSQFTVWQREDFRRRAARASTKNVPPPAAEQVARLIESTRKDASYWWQLNLALFLSDSGGGRTSEFTTDLTTTSGWQAASPADRATMLTLAAQYLRECSADDEESLRPNTFHRPSAAGLRALRLLHDLQPESLGTLHPTCWASWVAAIIATSANEDATGDLIRSQLARRAYAAAPDKFLSLLSIALERNINSFAIPRLVEEFVDNQILEILWKRVLAGTLEPHARDRAAQLVFRSAFEPALLWLHTEEDFALRSDPQFSVSELFVLGKAELFALNPPKAMPGLVALGEAALDAARQVWGRIANQSSYGNATTFLELLEPVSLITVYQTLLKLFVEPERESGEAYTVTTEDNASELRQRILTYLSTSGMASALDALRSIEREHQKEQPWLGWYVRQAEEAYVRTAWNWPSPRAALEKILVSGSFERERSQNERLASSIASLEAQSNGDVPAIAIDAQAEIQIAQVAERAASFTPRVLLVFATEWRPRHGGLSNLNRSFCRAMAAVGHTVICVVAEGDQTDIALAAEDRVQLIIQPPVPGISGASLLLTFHLEDHPGLVPDFVVGHDHVTGPQASQLSSRMSKAKYLHFIHTIPREIEPYKTGSDGDRNYGRGATKADDQEALCAKAALVIAVGPRIASSLQSDLPMDLEKIHQLTPGLDERLLAVNRPRPIVGDNRILFMGRTEDKELKGIDVAGAMMSWLDREYFYDARLVIRGVAPESLAQEAEAMCKKHGLRPHLVMPSTFSADPDTVRKDLESSSLLIMPSQVEGFGLVGLEAISAGVPVVLSADSGLARLLINLNVTGWERRIQRLENDTVTSGERWAEATHNILKDRTAAFEEASAFRDQLRSLLTWRRAAEDLSRKLDLL